MEQSPRYTVKWKENEDAKQYTTLALWGMLTYIDWYIDILNISIYMFISTHTMSIWVHKKLMNSGYPSERELQAWGMGAQNYLSLFNLLWF